MNGAVYRERERCVKIVGNRMACHDNPATDGMRQRSQAVIEELLLLAQFITEDSDGQGHELLGQASAPAD